MCGAHISAKVSEYVQMINNIFFAWGLKRRLLKVLADRKPDVLVFTHPFPAGAAAWAGAGDRGQRIRAAPRAGDRAHARTHR